MAVPQQAMKDFVSTESKDHELVMPQQEPMKEGEHKAEANVNDLIVYAGCFCCVESCYLQFPQCIGCEQEQECLCIKSAGICCKPGDMKEVICTCQKGECSIVMPKPYIKCQAQEFCIDARCALPFAPDVPNMCTICFITCLKDFKPNFGVFKKPGEFK